MEKNFLSTYELIKNYKSNYIEELVYKEKMLELIDTCDDCFLRQCRVGHFTASAFLLNKNMNHVCLMHHTKLDKWLQLGGHCDGDPDILNVSIKEASEESGIKNIKPLTSDIFDMDIHLVPKILNDEPHYHFDIRFLLHAYDDDTLIKNHESKELKWVQKFDKELSQNLIRMFEKLEKEVI